MTSINHFNHALPVPEHVMEGRMYRFLDDVIHVKRVPWKYLYYHIYRDIVGTNSLRNHYDRLELVDSLHHGVFESRTEDVRHAFGLYL